MGSKSLKGRVACMAEGGIVQNETPEQLMARMAAKYRIAAPMQQPAPQQQPAAQAPEQKTPQGIVGLLKDRNKALDRAANYAQGGIVARAFQFKGKGGPTDDEIPVKVAGQNINVSNGEKAVVLPAKTAQNPQAVTAIEDIIEQTNGKPTSRDGSNFANGGVPTTEETLANGPYTSEPGWSPARAFKGWQDKKIAETNAKIDIATGKVPAQPPVAQAASPIAAASSFAPEKPRFPLPDSGGQFMTGSEPGKPPVPTQAAPAADGIARRINRGGNTLITNVGGDGTQGMSAMDAPLANVPGSSPIPTIPGMSLSQRAGNPNLGTAADNLRQLENIQNANASMTPQGGAAFLADTNEAANAEKTQRWREDELIAKALRNPAAGQLANTVAQGGSHLAAEGIRSQATREGIVANAANALAAQGLTRRGQDITAQRDSERNRIDEMRLAGNPLDNQARQIEVEKGRRINSLQERALNGKTDAEKQEAIKALNVLNGRQSHAPVVVPGGEELDTNGMVKTRRPSAVYDNGQWMAPSAPSAKPSFEDYAAHVRGNNKGQQVTDDQIKAAYAKQFGAA